MYVKCLLPTTFSGTKKVLKYRIIKTTNVFNKWDLWKKGTVSSLNEEAPPIIRSLPNAENLEVRDVGYVVTVDVPQHLTRCWGSSCPTEGAAGTREGANAQATCEERGDRCCGDDCAYSRSWNKPEENP